MAGTDGSGGAADLLAQAKAAFEAGRLPQAEVLMRAALGGDPARAANDLGGLLRHTGRTAEAGRWFLRALAKAPGWATPRYNLALVLLSQGLHDLGWLLLEARRAIPALKAPAPDFPFPEWRGEPLAGQRLVILGEQGAGDQMMFARYEALAREAGARTQLVLDRAVAPLFPGAVAGVPRAVEADLWAPLMSLPLRLGAGGRIPPPARPPLELRRGGGVGVMARGAPAYVNDRNRSLFGEDEARLRALGRDLAPEATGAGDFLETARIVAGLDLVITADTAVAHLAGALGKPVWILVPALGTDWRWGLRGETTPWYPSARLYRQAAPGSWGEALDRIERDLARQGL